MVELFLVYCIGYVLISLRSDRPLALYVFANDKKVKDKGESAISFNLFAKGGIDKRSPFIVRNETISGTMAFNEVVIQLGGEWIVVAVSVNFMNWPLLYSARPPLRRDRCQWM